MALYKTTPAITLVTSSVVWAVNKVEQKLLRVILVTTYNRYQAKDRKCCMQLFCYVVIVSLILPLRASNKGVGLMVNPWWLYM